MKESRPPVILNGLSIPVEIVESMCRVAEWLRKSEMDNYLFEFSKPNEEGQPSYSMSVTLKKL